MTATTLMVVMGITWVIRVLVFTNDLIFVTYIFTTATTTTFQVI